MTEPPKKLPELVARDAAEGRRAPFGHFIRSGEKPALVEIPMLEIPFCHSLLFDGVINDCIRHVHECFAARKRPLVKLGVLPFSQQVLLRRTEVQTEKPMPLEDL